LCAQDYFWLFISVHHCSLGSCSSVDDEFSPLPDWLHWLEECPSTNRWAIDHAAELQHGDVVFTRRQTAGRGQHGRTWHSPAGVLTTSLVLDHLLPHQLPGLSLVAGLAVIRAVEARVPDLSNKLQLKWANDVFAAGRKLAGILCEATSGSQSAATRVVVGIGLNRCVDFAQAGLSPAQIGHAISLHQLAPVIPTEWELLAQLRDSLLQMTDLLRTIDASEAGLTPFLSELHDRDFLRNRPLTVSLAEESFIGQGTGIDGMGRLLVELPGGGVKAFVSGRVVDWDDEVKE
jgi:BirA family biotin operon repressor/biotin-[acetyl-CoA-carboxylase] ligase